MMSLSDQMNYLYNLLNMQLYIPMMENQGGSNNKILNILNIPKQG